MTKQKYPVVHIGSVSILTIFVTLCLVTFATLSYISAGREQALGEKTASRTAAYYAAASKAEEWIAETDRNWKEFYTSDPAQFASSSAETSASVSIPIDERSVLEITLEATLPEKNNGRLYRITRYTKVSSRDWNGDDTLHLMNTEKE